MEKILSKGENLRTIQIDVSKKQLIINEKEIKEFPKTLFHLSAGMGKGICVYQLKVGNQNYDFDRCGNQLNDDGSVQEVRVDELDRSRDTEERRAKINAYRQHHTLFEKDEPIVNVDIDIPRAKAEINGKPIIGLPYNGYSISVIDNAICIEVNTTMCYDFDLTGCQK